MHQEDSIEIIRQRIQSWNSHRKTTQAIEQLTSGYGFEISRDEYKLWKSIVDKSGWDPDSNALEPKIHVYLAINESRLVFYLVDSITDKKGGLYQLGLNIFYKEFHRSMQDTSLESQEFFPSITPKEALDRIFGWFLYSRDWFEQKIDDHTGEAKNVVRVFTFPYSDLSEIFSSPCTIGAVAFFGLEKSPGAKPLRENQIDLILCDKRDSSCEIRDRSYEDVSIPHPPFEIDHNQFKLLGDQ